MSWTIYIPDMAELEEVRRDVGCSSLGEALDDEYFGKVEEQIHKYESGESTALNSLYSLLQPPEKRRKFIEFIERMKQKMGSREWGDLCERLSSGQGLRDVNAAFEVTIAGNILAQMPPERVQLHALTNAPRNVDVCIHLDRPIYIETTVLGESQENIQWRKSLASGPKIRMGDSFSVFGGRATRAISQKSPQFLPSHPNVLVISIFDVWDKLEPAQKPLASSQFQNIGLLLPFGRERLMSDWIARPDPACRLTAEEEKSVLHLLNGENFFPIGYV
jgi:hypothetical protein